MTVAEDDNARDCPCGGTCPGPNAHQVCERVTAYTGEHGEIVADRCIRAQRLHEENQRLTEELALIRNTLQLRTHAMHRVARTNDHLRTLLANQENQ